MLFSATQTTKVADLARISLRPGPVHVDVDSEESTSTVTTLSQGYVVCPSERRFLLLFTFLKKTCLTKDSKKKVIVFFSSCNSVKYHAELLNYIDVPVLDLHVCQAALFFLSWSTFNARRVLGEAKTAKTHKHFLRVHKCPIRYPSLHRCRSSRIGHSKGRLDRAI